ncbi:MAG TPA: hypothetical protein VMU84_05555 [Thermoanaerobaculia bacterium]|nr:hypothetical protein [Thermoanaerobaculia bacterium]
MNVGRGIANERNYRPYEWSDRLKLDKTTILGRMFLRYGRFAIALVSIASMLVAGVAIYLFTALTMGVWFPRITLFGGMAVAGGVYTLFDRLNLIPEDPDKLITLSLTQYPGKEDDAR